MNMQTTGPGPTDPTTTQEIVPGPKVMIMGDAGTGKSTSIKTLIKAGITPFVIATEQNAVQALKDLPDGSWHYKYIPPTSDDSFDNLYKMSENINKLSFENITKWADPNRGKQTQYLELITAMRSFTCDCHKIKWGDASKWNTDRALVLDGLSGLSDMVKQLVVGIKPMLDQGQWQIGQNTLKPLLNICTTQLTCTFVLISHIDREKNEITGGSTIMAKTLGAKLAPDIPRMFSDVVLARREGPGNYIWDTVDANAVVVGRHIAASGKNPADFVPLIGKWKAMGGVIIPTPST